MIKSHRKIHPLSVVLRLRVHLQTHSLLRNLIYVPMNAKMLTFIQQNQPSQPCSLPPDLAIDLLASTLLVPSPLRLGHQYQPLPPRPLANTSPTWDQFNLTTYPCKHSLLYSLVLFKHLDGTGPLRHLSGAQPCPLLLALDLDPD